MGGGGGGGRGGARERGEGAGPGTKARLPEGSFRRDLVAGSGGRLILTGAEYSLEFLLFHGS